MNTTRTNNMPDNLMHTIEDEKKFYKTLLELASDGVHILDSNGRLVLYSKSFTNMLGYSDNEMNNLYVYDWDNSVMKKNIKDFINSLSSTPLIFETKHKRKDGSVYDAEISAKCIELEGEIYLYASSRDITDKKQTDEKISKAEKKFHSLFDESLDGIALLDLNTQCFIEFNQKVLDMYGYDAVEFMKVTPRDLDILHDQEQIIKTQQNIQEKGIDRFITKHKTKNGAILDVLVNAVKLDIDDEPCLYVSIHDITEIQTTNKEMQVLKQKYHSLFESSPDAYFILDAEAELITDCNKATEKMLMGTRLDIIGLTPYAISSHSKQDDEKSKKLVRKKIAECLNGEISRFEWLLKRLDNEEFWAEITISLIKLDSKTVLFVAMRDISEIKKLHIIVEAEQKRYKTIMELASDGIHIMDTNGNVVSYSNAFAKMLGCTGGELKKRNISDWDVQIASKDIKNTIQSLIEKPSTFETKHKRKDGSVYDAEISAKGIVLEGKAFLYASARDITEKKERERELEAQKQEFEAIFKGSKDGIAITDLNSYFIDCNDAYLEMIGFTREELMHKSCFELSDPQDVERTKNAIKEVFDVGFVKDFEKTCIVKNGKRIVVSTSISLLSDKQRILMSTKDITASKRVEENLKKSEQFFKTIAESSPLAVCFTEGNEQVIKYVNPRFTEMLGYTLEDVPFASDWWISAYPDDTYRKYVSDEWNMKIKKALENSSTIEAVESRVKCKDGSVKIIEWHYVAISNTGWIFGLDLTDLRNYSNELEMLNSSLHQKIESETKSRLEKERLLIQQSRLATMGEMIGNIAHQWRQPLNTLAFIVQTIPIIIKRGEVDIDYAYKMQTESMDLIKYMSQTIDDFRNFFKPDREKELFDIKQSISKAVSLIKDALKSSSIEVIINLCDDELYVHGYNNEFSQVVINLLKNAKDALQNRSALEKKCIWVEAQKINNKIKISVSDNGGGIKQGIIEKIFDPYFTTKHSSLGTGLGLYMSKMIVEQNMNGKLLAHNTKDGACFEVELRCDTATRQS